MGYLLAQHQVLNGELHEEMYLTQLEGFIIKRNESKVYQLKKALYGLKQEPGAWYSHIDEFFM